MNSHFAARRRALQAQLADEHLDALVITGRANGYYLTGFTGESGVLIVSPRGQALITDGRFTTQASEESPSLRVIPQKRSALESVGGYLIARGWKRIGFDPAQLTVGQFRTLKRATSSVCRWVRAGGLVERLRTRKEPSEIVRIQEAGILAGRVLERTVPLLKPGVREFEVAAEIEYQMRKNGASAAAFETIVAFGKRSALPHARATAKRLKKNELVVLDLGAILGHYCSDITRTVFCGRASSRVKRWYQAVLEAQSAAIAAARSGAACGDVDAAARETLKGCGLHRYFVHSTGHGLGLEVHEDPRVARGQKKRLEPGNVITVEPGIYVPGVGGIRIEDDVAVYADKTQVLTRVSRDFIEL